MFHANIRAVAQLQKPEQGLPYARSRASCRGGNRDVYILSLASCARNKVVGGGLWHRVFFPLDIFLLNRDNFARKTPVI